MYVGWVCVIMLAAGLGSLSLLGASASGGFILLAGVIDIVASQELNAFNAVVLILGLTLCVHGRVSNR